MSPNLRRISRSLHLWLSLVIFIPVVVVIGSGLLLQVKKESDWIQPPTMKMQGGAPTLSFEQVIASVKQVPKVQIYTWEDIDRLDVRPGKGIIKVRGKNHWEVQLDARTGDVLHVAYRRSDTIEAIHDGSWFFDGAKLWVFLPAAVLLFILWITGMVMLVTTLKSKYAKRHFRSKQNR